MIRSVDPDIVVKLSLLRKYRNAADYEMDISIDAITRNAEDGEAFAIEIIARLDELAADQIAARSIDRGSSDTGEVIPEPE